MITGIIVAVIWSAIGLWLVGWSVYDITWWWREFSKDGMGISFFHLRESLSDESVFGMLIGLAMLTVITLAILS